MASSRLGVGAAFEDHGPMAMISRGMLEVRQFAAYDPSPSRPERAVPFARHRAVLLVRRLIAGALLGAAVVLSLAHLGVLNVSPAVAHLNRVPAVVLARAPIVTTSGFGPYGVAGQSGQFVGP